MYFCLVEDSIKAFMPVLFEEYSFVVTRIESGMGKVVIIENRDLIIRLLDDRGFRPFEFYIKSSLDKKYDFGEYNIYIIWEYLFKAESSYKTKYPQLFQCVSECSFDHLASEMTASFVNQEIEVFLAMFSSDKLIETKRMLDDITYKRNVNCFGKKRADELKEAQECFMKVELYRKNLPEQK